VSDYSYLNKIFEVINNNLKNREFKSAEESLKKILEKNPQNVKALFLLGSVYLELKQFKDSTKLLNKAIDLDPNISNAHNNLGIIYFKQRDFKKAKMCIFKSLEINPKNLDAYNYLGLIYSELGDFENAIDKTKKALEINKNYFPGYNNLGLIYKKFEYFYDAEISFKKAISINYKFTNSYYNLMELYEKTNQSEKLNELILEFEKLFKINSISTLYKSHLLYKKESFLDAIKNLEILSFNNDSSQEIDRVNLLARCYDKIDDIDNAFSYFEKTNALNLRNLNKEIDKNRFLNKVKIRIDCFEKFNETKFLPSKKNKNYKPIFMVGFPRSGTTLLDTILRSHPMIEVIEEKPATNKLINSLNKLTNNSLININDIDSKKVEEINLNYFEEITSYSKKLDFKKIYIDKLPLNIIYIAEIQKIFPEAKFIISLRHPCDCVLSCFIQNFKLNDSMSNFLNLNDTANLYDLVMRLYTIYKKKISFNFTEVKYENIVTNFNSEIKKLLEFLDVPWNDSVLEYQKTAKQRERIFTPSYDQVIKPLYTKSIGRWTKYKPKLSRVYSTLEPWISEFGYE